MDMVNQFDSNEEREFEAWCKDAFNLGMLSDVVYHPPSFQLSPRQSIQKTVQMKSKTKLVDAFLFHPHEYTADFQLSLTEYGKGFLGERGLFLTPCLNKMFVDVKGGFNIYNDDKSFSINQKWVFEKHGVFIYKIVPKKWFAKTWVPEMARRSPKKGIVRECYKNCQTIETINNKSKDDLFPVTGRNTPV